MSKINFDAVLNLAIALLYVLYVVATAWVVDDVFARLALILTPLGIHVVLADLHSPCDTAAELVDQLSP